MSLYTNLPLQTADGRPVELITAKGRDAAHPLTGYRGDDESITAWSPLGYCKSGNPNDRLVNALITGTIYVVTYFDKAGRRQTYPYTDANSAREASESMVEAGSIGVTLVELPYSADVGQNDLAENVTKER